MGANLLYVLSTKMLQISAGKMDFCALNDLEMVRNKQIDRNFVQKLHACEGSTCRNP